MSAQTVDASMVTSKTALVVAHLAEQKVDWVVGLLVCWLVLQTACQVGCAIVG